MVTECWPGFRLARLNGVTQAELLCPSIWICAPAGLEVTLSCPGTIAGATGRDLVFFLGAYFGCTETAGGSAVTGSGATCTGVGAAAGVAGVAAWAEALAADCAGEVSSSAF